MKLTQEEKVLKYFDTHKTALTRQYAMNNLYIMNITAVISNLRKHGHDIETVKKKSKNATYGSYVLYE